MSFLRRVQVQSHAPASFLYPGEELIASQPGVGLYNGKEKSPNHQNGTAHVTSHRLLYVDEADPLRLSLELSLAHIRGTEGYAGFLRSSAKIILYLGYPDGEEPDESDGKPQDVAPSEAGWVCPICSFANPPALADTRPQCVLCGVTRQESISTPVRTPSPAQDASTSTPSAEAGQTSSLIPCPGCTFLNHPSLVVCEICSTPLRPSRPSTRPPSPFPEGLGADMMKLSFRKGGEPKFYAALKRVLLGKGWQTPTRKSVDRPDERMRLGIGCVLFRAFCNRAVSYVRPDGIMQSFKSDRVTQDEGMQASFKDLEALMINAKAMVAQAESLNERLTAYENSLPPGQTMDLPEEATFIRSSLFRLGLSGTALTRDMIKDDEKYSAGLARELVAVLQGANGKKGVMGAKGILGLDEVWAAWNRARGVSLLPPDTLMQVIPLLSAYSNPRLSLRTFKSGLRSLTTPQFEPGQFRTRLISRLNKSPLTTMEIAREEMVSVGLATELVESVEESGGVARDEGARGEIRWWTNEFERFIWDGTTFD